MALPITPATAVDIAPLPEAVGALSISQGWNLSSPLSRSTRIPSCFRGAGGSHGTASARRRRIADCRWRKRQSSSEPGQAPVRRFGDAAGRQLFSCWDGGGMVAAGCAVPDFTESGSVIRSRRIRFPARRVMLIFAKFLPGIDTMAPPLAGIIDMRHALFRAGFRRGCDLYPHLFRRGVYFQRFSRPLVVVIRRSRHCGLVDRRRFSRCGSGTGCGTTGQRREDPVPMLEPEK